jgi:DNA (cytosine-5)-methyltransferase 1
MKVDKPIISLFSGAMGLDLGLEAAGFRTAVAIEKSKMAVETIRLNRDEDFPIFDEAIEGVDVDEVLDFAGLKPGEAFILTGGPCCQSFSTVGKRRSLSDAKRGTLFREFKRFVVEARPRFFIMENVKGMLSAAVKHRPLDERGPGFAALSPEEELGSAFRIIRNELADLNYYVGFGLVNCADYGVPQKRLRVVFIGSRDGEDIVMPKRTHSEKGTDGTLPWVTLEQAIGKMSGEEDHVSFSKERKELLSRLKAGQNWHDLPKSLHRKALGAAAKTWGGRSGFCRRLGWNKPAPTLTTDPIGRATTLCHPQKLRPLTVQEYAKLQQFPDDWKFFGVTSQKYVQIGNAVPTGLGLAIGTMLGKVAKNTDAGRLPANAKSRLGTVVAFDPQLEKWLKSRRKTQLHPAWKRKNKDPEAAREWLAEVAA